MGTITITRGGRYGRQNEVHDMVKWVLSAASKDKLRQNICQTVLVDTDRTMVATDGNRMHYFMGTLYEPGLYRLINMGATIVISDDDTKNLTFPDWRRPIPKQETTLDIKSDKPSIVLYQLAHKMICIDMDFFKAAWPIMSHDLNTQLYYGDEKQPIHFKGIELGAVIMPLRVSDMNIQTAWSWGSQEQPVSSLNLTRKFDL